MKLGAASPTLSGIRPTSPKALLGDPPDGGQRRRRPGPSRHLEPAKDKSTEQTGAIVAIGAARRAMLATERVPRTLQLGRCCTTSTSTATSWAGTPRDGR
jgi:hypothetical protein